MFTGFNEPKENWSKLPNEFVDALPMIETIGEMKVILYILRHTWGFHDDEKKITLDEFAILPHSDTAKFVKILSDNGIKTIRKKAKNKTVYPDDGIVI